MDIGRFLTVGEETNYGKEEGQNESCGVKLVMEDQCEFTGFKIDM